MATRKLRTGTAVKSEGGECGVVANDRAVNEEKGDPVTGWLEGEEVGAFIDVEELDEELIAGGRTRAGRELEGERSIVASPKRREDAR